MAEVFQWDDSYVVGIAEFDEDHKLLVSLGNAVIKASVEKRGEAVAREVLDELIRYTKEHFAREERLMVSTGYHGVDDHKIKHKRLVNEVLLFKSQFLAGDVEVSKIANFLINWIIKHILEEDQQYVEHFRSVGLPRNASQAQPTPG